LGREQIRCDAVDSFLRRRAAAQKPHHGEDQPLVRGDRDSCESDRKCAGRPDRRSQSHLQRRLLPSAARQGAEKEKQARLLRDEAVRRFNRFYTQRIGVLREGLYESAYSLAEVRVLYELAHAEGSLTASDLVRTLTIDAGYLSRVLRGFEAKGLIRKSRSADDGRQWHLTLTATGRKAFAPLETASRNEVAVLLEPLSGSAQDDMVG